MATLTGDECAICLMELAPLNGPFSVRETLGCCGKMVCKTCYLNWFEPAQNDKTESIVCPLCSFRHPPPVNMDGLHRYKAHQGQSWAQFILGNKLVKEAIEVKEFADEDCSDWPELKEGLKLLRDAVKQNHVRAMITLATMHQYGWGLPVSLEQVDTLYQSIMEHGTPQEQDLAKTLKMTYE